MRLEAYAQPASQASIPTAETFTSIPNVLTGFHSKCFDSVVILEPAGLSENAYAVAHLHKTQVYFLYVLNVTTPF